MIEDLTKEFSDKKIDFTAIRLNDLCDKMFDVMKKHYNKNGMSFNVTDLADAAKFKTKEEITKMFVEKASFILSAKLGGKPGTGR